MIEMLGGWGPIALIGLVLLIGGQVWLSRRLGQASATTDQQAATLKAVETRHETDDAVARDPDPVGSLQHRWTRD